MSELNDLVTTEEAKKICGRSVIPWKVYGIEFPRPKRKIGSSNLYSRDELLAWLSEYEAAKNATKSKRARHRMTPVCVVCGEPWPCSTKLADADRCQAVTANGERCRIRATMTSYADDGLRCCRKHRWYEGAGAVDEAAAK